MATASSSSAWQQPVAAVHGNSPLSVRVCTRVCEHVLRHVRSLAKKGADMCTLMHVSRCMSLYVNLSIDMHIDISIGEHIDLLVLGWWIDMSMDRYLSRYR